MFEEPVCANQRGADELYMPIFKRTEWFVSLCAVAMGLEVLFAILWSTRSARAEPGNVASEGRRNGSRPGAGVAGAVGPEVRPYLTPAAVAATNSRPVVPAKPVDNAQVLDERRKFALGMIETGNDDREVGQAGEVSRYQIMPGVWKRYSQSARYRDPEVSGGVARKHWSVLSAEFTKRTGRRPSDFDMYVLWNTRYGYYASKGFKPGRLYPEVHERARNFVNLVKSRA